MRALELLPPLRWRSLILLAHFLTAIMRDLAHIYKLYRQFLGLRFNPLRQSYELHPSRTLSHFCW
jgi:hypothetical protein